VRRPCGAHASHGAVALLKRLVAALRARWPTVEIALGADSGFAVPAVYDFCERAQVEFTVGLAPNPRLRALAAPLVEQVAQEHQQTGAKVRRGADGQYAADSWPHPRRVVFKAEELAQGSNLRFVVTNRTDLESLPLYDWYVDRGEAEQWIKDFKRGCAADRLSCHRFWANQFRLLLHAAAYGLLDTLRRMLVAAGCPRLQLDTLRLRLVKIGGWVRALGAMCPPRFHLHLARSHPGEPLCHLLSFCFPLRESSRLDCAKTDVPLMPLRAPAGTLLPLGRA
jgi:hypothetical protein